MRRGLELGAQSQHAMPWAGRRSAVALAAHDTCAARMRINSTPPPRCLNVYSVFDPKSLMFDVIIRCLINCHLMFVQCLGITNSMFNITV
jgi:hypothetical protein